MTAPALDLDAIEARAIAAEKGPMLWSQRHEDDPNHWTLETLAAGAEFLHRARTDIPLLVAALRDAQAEAERLTTKVTGVWRVVDDWKRVTDTLIQLLVDANTQADAQSAAVLALCDGVMPSSPYTLAAEIRAVVAAAEVTGRHVHDATCVLNCPVKQAAREENT